jgi:hypothetical protein
LPRRLREALTYVERKGAADTLDQELRYLADNDVARLHGSFALVRIIIWAIPILGFLGTVIGITMALASLSLNLEQSMQEVKAGLATAFDTTALSLSLSMVLMFTQFFCERYETRLLERVDAAASSELVGRFEESAGGSDPHVAAVRRMVEAVLQSSDRLVHRQAELWQQSIGEAQRQWSQLAAAAGGQLEGALAAALRQSLQDHARGLAEAEAALAEKSHQQWRQVQEALQSGAAAVSGQQRELVRQGEVLGQVVAAVGQVARLEDSLNQNLAALAAAGHLQETLTSLSAAVQLLIARLGPLPAEGPPVQLRQVHRPGQAA